MSERPNHRSNGRGTAPDTARFLSLDRFNAFSDGVFAIAITLLVLELPIPPKDVAMLPALLEAKYEFLGYIISFAFIGGLWLTHSGLTRRMRQGDAVAYGMNLLMLLFVAILPFSTRLMVTHVDAPDVEAGVLVYGLTVLAASSLLSLLMFYVAREPDLASGEIADEELGRLYRQRWSVIGVNIFALVVALVAPRVAVSLYLVMTVLMLALPLLAGVQHRRRRKQARG